MAFAETAPLIAQLDLKGNFTPSLKRASSALASFASRMDTTSVRFQRAGQQIGTGIRNIGLIAATAVGALATQVAAGLRSLVELEQQTAQTEAVIKSTGGVAGVTAAEVGRLSEKWEGLNATIGDEFVRAGANMLLTFTNIRGKGFEPALEAVLDLNTALGKGPEGLTGTAILVGKALNDPIRGLTALRRVGVQLTEAQEKQIRTLVEQNDLYGAQQVIIKELNKEFGGSFIAQGNTTAGKVAKFTDSIEDLQRALAEALLPTLGNVADALTKTLADPSVVQGVRDFGKSLAELVSPANLATAGRIIQDVFSAAKSAAPVIAAAAKTMFSVVSAAVNVFSSLPKEIQQLAVGAFAINKLTGGLVTNIAGGLIGAVLKQLVSGVVNVSGGVVNVVGAGAGVPGVVGGAKGGLGLASKVFLVGEAIGLALLVNEVRNGIAEGNTATSEGLVKQTNEWLAQNPSKDDLRNGLGAVEKGITELATSNLPLTLVQGESLDNLKLIRELIIAQLALDNSPDARQARADLHKMALVALAEQRRGERGQEELHTIGGTLTALQIQMHSDLVTAIGVLKASDDATAIGAAVAAAVASITGGAGSAGTTTDLVGTLKTQLEAALASGNTDLAAKIKAAIKEIEPFAKGRQWQTEQIAAARDVVASNKTVAEKTAALKGIQSDLLSHQRTMAAEIVGGLLAVVNAVKAIKLPAGQTPTVNPKTGFVTGGTPAPKPTAATKRVARPGDSEFATGAWNIPRNMAAFIHKGEMILPSRLAEKLRRSLTDEEQRQAEEELRAQAERASRQAERARLLQASLATQRLRAGRSAPTRSSEMFGGRFIPSAMLDASQIQDRRQLPVPNVAVTVNVTAAQVTKSIVIQKRFGPPNGSRGAMPGDSGV